MVASLAHHNSRGTACMDEPAFPAIDLVGGSLGALALVYTGTAEESPGWLVIPGVFILSGLIASATVYACRNPDPDQPGTGVARPAPKSYQPPDNVIPQDEPDEPEVRDATLEERGMTVPVQVTPAKAPDVAPAAPSPPKPTTCSINPLVQCPEGWSCVLTDHDTGVCRLDSEHAAPRTELP